MEELYKQLTKKLLDKRNYNIVYFVPNMRFGSYFIYNYSKFLYYNYSDFYSSKSDKISFVNGSEFFVKTSYSELKGYNIKEIYLNKLFNESNSDNERQIFPMLGLNNFHIKNHLLIFFKKIIH